MWKFRAANAVARTSATGSGVSLLARNGLAAVQVFFYIFGLALFAARQGEIRISRTGGSPGTGREIIIAVAIFRVPSRPRPLSFRCSFVFAVLPFLPPPTPSITRDAIAPRIGARARPVRNLNCPSDYRLKLPAPVSFRLSFIHLAVIPKFIRTTYVCNRPRGLDVGGTKTTGGWAGRWLEGKSIAVNVGLGRTWI